MSLCGGCNAVHAPGAWTHGTPPFWLTILMPSHMFRLASCRGTVFPAFLVALMLTWLQVRLELPLVVRAQKPCVVGMQRTKSGVVM